MGFGYFVGRATRTRTRSDERLREQQATMGRMPPSRVTLVLIILVVLVIVTWLLTR